MVRINSLKVLDIALDTWETMKLRSVKTLLIPLGLFTLGLGNRVPNGDMDISTTRMKVT